MDRRLRQSVNKNEFKSTTKEKETDENVKEKQKPDTIVLHISKPKKKKKLSGRNPKKPERLNVPSKEYN